MGKQSARMYYQRKDHKDIFFKGKYHMAMYKGKELVWKKIFGNEYIVFVHPLGNQIKILYLKEKEIYSFNEEHGALLINDEGVFLASMYYPDVSDLGLFLSRNGTRYKYISDVSLKIDRLRIFPIHKKGFYSSYVENLNYKMNLYSLNENGDSVVETEVFSEQHKNNLSTQLFLINATIYESDKIPFFYFSSSSNSEFGKSKYFYYAHGSEVKKVNIILGEDDIIDFGNGINFCKNNVYYMMSRIPGSVSDKMRVYYCNLNTLQSGMFKDVLQLDYSGHYYFNCVIDGTAYIYHHDEKGFLYCCETSNFITFKKTKCNEVLNVKNKNGEYIEIHTGFSTSMPRILSPSSGESCANFVDGKMEQKKCLLLLPRIEAFVVFVDNMYFNDSENNFAI